MKMTSIVKFQALSGALDESPYCYLLQVDDFTFLLDCGWDEKFDDVYIAEVIKHVPQIDAVLLSFPDPLHIGALPYLVGKCGLTCPVYSTVPVYKMGQMFMYDIYQSRQNGEDFSLFTLDDVDAAFDKIIQLKYNQSCGLKGKGYGLTITPLPAGHMLGGTAWKIVKDGEEDIVYAVDYNHKKERHLNSCELEKIQRPSLLITDGYNATYQQPRRRARDEKLMTNILQTLRNNGNVLVAVDTAGRVLELSHMLDQLWRNKESGLMAYSLAMLNNVSYNVVEFAKSQIEWMSDKLMRSFEGARNNPFQFKHLQLCHSMAELNRVPSPKVVLASTPDMECGFSRELFAQWCENPRNSIVITSRSSPGTLSRRLIDNRNLKKVTLEIHKRVKLEGSELEEYMRKEKEKVVENNLKIEPMLEDESSDSEDEMNTAIKGKHDIILKSEDKINVTGFFKSSRKQFPMYPYHEEKVRSDEYGEIIRPEDFTVVDGIEEIEIDKPEKKRKFGKKDEEAPDAPEVPTKCVTETVTLAIMASVTYIDFEGRSDGESIQKIVQQMRPRRTVLVRGTAEACDVLASLLLTNPAAGVPGPTGECKVFIPKIGDIVDATMESHIFQVRLKDSLLSSLNFSRIKEGEVAWLDGKIAFHWEDMQDITLDEDPSKEGIAITKKGLAPVLEPLSADEVAGHSATFINELKLSDFKQVLVKYGISSEFVGGVLWCCNATVGLRKNEAGQMILEGCLSEDYFKVRDILYEQYAIV